MPDPSDPAAIGRFSEAMLAETLYIGTPAIEVAVEKFIKPARGLALNDAALDALRATLRTNFAVVDRILATRPYMAGDEYGLVDIFYTPSIHLLERSGEIGVMEGLKHLANWWAKVKSRKQTAHATAEAHAAFDELMAMAKSANGTDESNRTGAGSKLQLPCESEDICNY
ncbi:hypothetical protein LTR60_001613 [Cryomyces antarcticus]|nr:hypothetical protein LTR60_001613 [Cryomyces antarcticus]